MKQTNVIFLKCMTVEKNLVSQTINSIIVDECGIKNTIFSVQAACKDSLYKENCRCRIYSTIRYSSIPVFRG